MLQKKEVLTIITPLPSFIPRKLAVDILHSHSEVITLNPLVLSHKPVPAPGKAETDEYFSTWYQITERIQYLPGISGKIRFQGCFHDLPLGLQTHIYAPLGIDLRVKYIIDGNQANVEPPLHMEIGLAALGAPSDGLYLREDITIQCNITMVSFVRNQMKAASKEMVSRIVKKAELLEVGVLKSMIEGGRLKTINPADRSSAAADAAPQSLHSSHSPVSPDHAVPYRPAHLAGSMSPRMSLQSSLGNGQQQQQLLQQPHLQQPHLQQQHLQQQHLQQQHPQQHSPPPGCTTFARPSTGSSSSPQYPPQWQWQQPWQVPIGSNEFPAEMPGDNAYHSVQQQQPPPQPQQTQQTQSRSPSQQNSPQPSPGLQPPASFRVSSMSHVTPPPPPPPHPDVRWSSSQSQYSGSHRGSFSSDYGSNNNNSRSNSSQPSPGIYGGFSAELSSHAETAEEHRASALEKLDPRRKSSSPPVPPPPPPPAAHHHSNPVQNVGGKVMYAYNPADFVRTVT